MDAYARADEPGVRSIVLDFTGLDYMNSGGIGLLVTLLVRAQRARPARARLRALRPLPPDLRAHPPRRGDGHPRRRGAARSRRRHDATGRPSPTDIGGKRPMSPDPGLREDVAEDLPRALAGELGPEVIADGSCASRSFWPEGNRFYGPLTGIAPGEVALHRHGDARPRHAVHRRAGALRRRGVVHADDAAGPHVRRLDHLQRRGGRRRTPLVQAQVLMRASDPLYEIGLTFGGHRQEDRFWARDADRARRPLRARRRGRHRASCASTAAASGAAGTTSATAPPCAPARVRARRRRRRAGRRRPARCSARSRRGRRRGGRGRGGLELVGVVVAVPHGDLAVGEARGDLARRAAGDGEHQRRGAVGRRRRRA